MRPSVISDKKILYLLSSKNSILSNNRCFTDLCSLVVAIYSNSKPRVIRAWSCPGGALPGRHVRANGFSAVLLNHKNIINGNY
jgi:hypothetical protein